MKRAVPASGMMVAVRIEIVLYEGFDELDAIAPYEVFSRVRRNGGDLAVALVTLVGSVRVTGAHGTVVETQDRLSERPDLLIVPGGGWAESASTGVRAEIARGALPAAVAERHAAGTVIASVCTGAMLLAAAAWFLALDEQAPSLLSKARAAGHAAAREFSLRLSRGAPAGARGTRSGTVARCRVRLRVASGRLRVVRGRRLRGTRRAGGRRRTRAGSGRARPR